MATAGARATHTGKISKDLLLKMLVIQIGVRVWDIQTHPLKNTN
jgi:hypothetical protein